MGVHPIARLARFSVTHVVRKDDEIAAGIEQLTGPKQHIGKLWSKKLAPGTAGAVQDEHGIGHFALGVPLWLAKAHVVQPEFGESFARFEMEVAAHIIAFLGRSVGGWLGWRVLVD